MLGSTFTSQRARVCVDGVTFRVPCDPVRNRRHTDFLPKAIIWSEKEDFDTVSSCQAFIFLSSSWWKWKKIAVFSSIMDSLCTFPLSLVHWDHVWPALKRSKGCSKPLSDLNVLQCRTVIHLISPISHEPKIQPLSVSADEQPFATRATGDIGPAAAVSRPRIDEYMLHQS